MRFTVRLAAALGVALVQGCASIGYEECAIADWRTVGLEDGARGATPDAIGRYRTACAEHGVVPDLNAYMQGREEGLRSFCTPGSGFNLGAGGGYYAGVCPQDTELVFLDAFSAGRKLYELETAADRAYNNLTAANDELAHVRQNLAGAQAAIVSGQATVDERVQLALDIRELARRQGELEHQIVDLEHELDRRNRQLARYRSRLAYVPDP
jgi:hypothetical protein